MLTALALLLIGFSLFSALALALTHFRAENYPDQVQSRIMGLILLLALGGLQLAHFVWLYFDLAWVLSLPYRLTLFAVAPTFFLFSQPVLHPTNPAPLRASLLWHAAPLVLCPALPSAAALPMAFIVGAGYLLWLAHSLYLLRQERLRFRLEIVLLGTVFAVAICVAALGLFQAALPEKLFFILYASAIGMAFFLVQTTLALHPQLSAEVRETVKASYATSTLVNVDCNATIAQLDALMQVERLYVDAELSLPKLADRLQLSTHQLSELINARLGKNFSRYLRELRVGAAKTMLRDEPRASVLSIGLNAGFTSQSNFYEAFREIEGMTPGQYRKLQSTANTTAP